MKGRDEARARPRPSDAVARSMPPKVKGRDGQGRPSVFGETGPDEAKGEAQGHKDDRTAKRGAKRREWLASPLMDTLTSSRACVVTLIFQFVSFVTVS